LPANPKLLPFFENDPHSDTTIIL